MDVSWHMALCALAAAVAGCGGGWCACRWTERLLGERVPPAWTRRACATLAVTWLALVVARGVSLATLELCLLSVVLTTVTLTDLTALLIPNVCVLATLGVHVLCTVPLAATSAEQAMAALASCVMGALLVGVPLVGLTLAMDRMLGRESMGGGDLKLLSAAGFCLGALPAFAVVALACVLGLLMAAVAGESEERSFAFGPAIAVAWLALGACLPVLQTWTNAGVR